MKDAIDILQTKVSYLTCETGSIPAQEKKVAHAEDRLQIEKGKLDTLIKEKEGLERALIKLKEVM